MEFTPNNYIGGGGEGPFVRSSTELNEDDMRVKTIGGKKFVTQSSLTNVVMLKKGKGKKYRMVEVGI